MNYTRQIRQADTMLKYLLDNKSETEQTQMEQLNLLSERMQLILEEAIEHVKNMFDETD